MRSRHLAAISAAAACAALAIFTPLADAQYEAPSNALWNAPTGYYNLATGTGATLKSQLYSTISVSFNEGTQAHTGTLPMRNYGDTRYAARVLFRDPAITDNILWVYDRTSHPYVWDAGATWNREHSWPQSKLGVSVGNTYIGPGSDLFEIYPADSGGNSLRGNAAYGLWPYSASTPGLNSGYWYPGPADRGDIARSMFYMATRYGQDQDGGSHEAPQNLSLVDGQGGVGQMGHLTTLLHWHYEDGVDNFERRRNFITYTPDSSANGWDIAGRPALYNQVYNQGNRNPYIDHPEYVWAVFGPGTNDSKIYVGGSPAPANGASSTSVTLRVIKDAANWSSGNVTVNKTGLNPTTYDVITGGSATTTAAGPGQPFVYDPTSRVIPVSLSGGTSTVGAGVVTGTVTIDNTDLTTTAATGTGSTDGNDTINVSGNVLDHAQSSFIAGSSAAAQTLDFGYIPAGFAARNANFNVYNNAAPAGAALTASLDVDGVSKIGSAAMTTNVTASNPATPTAPGGSKIYIAGFTPGSTEGLVTATHTIANSDENIPGATARPNLVLTTTGRVTTGNFPVTGNLFLLGGETFNTTSFNIADGATITKSGSGTMNVNGAQSHGASAALIADSGPVNLLSDSNSTADAGLSVATNASPLTFQSVQHLRRLELAGTGNATVTPGGNHTLVLGALDFTSNTARLNVNDNNLIVHNASVGTSNNGVYDGMQGLVQRGYNFSAWDQSGIVTTMPDAIGGLTTLGVARADGILFIAPTETATWRGETVSGSDVLTMYTYAGDVNFDGLVDASDYGIIDNYYQFSGTDGYANGDFNYDGLIDAGDYGLIDNSFQLQGPPIGSSSSGVALGSVSAVPEPTLGIALLAALPLLSRRRRRGQHP